MAQLGCTGKTSGSVPYVLQLWRAQSVVRKSCAFLLKTWTPIKWYDAYLNKGRTHVLSSVNWILPVPELPAGIIDLSHLWLKEPDVLSLMLKASWGLSSYHDHKARSSNSSEWWSGLNLHSHVKMFLQVLLLNLGKWKTRMCNYGRYGSRVRETLL